MAETRRDEKVGRSEMDVQSLELDEEEVAMQKRYEAAKKSDFFQQRLRSWRPLITPAGVAVIFAIVGVLFAFIGAMVLVASDRTVELSARYDNQCSLGGTVCNVTIEVDRKMDGPVYFYYKLVNFYQNHRQYVMDYEILQLQGDLTDTQRCTVSDVKERNGIPVYPCGLIANSMFTDSFSLARAPAGSSAFTTLTGDDWDASDLSWRSDRDTKFSNFTEGTLDEVTRVGTEGNVLPFPNEQEFQVWFRVAGLPRFNKLHRRISRGFDKGDQLRVTIIDRFDAGNFGGEKHVVLTTTTWLGGSNYFLGSVYIIVAVMCIVFALSMFVKRQTCPRTIGEMRYYGWTGLG